MDFYFLFPTFSSSSSKSDPPGQLYVEILRGQSENTNSKPTFDTSVDGSTVNLRIISSGLDFERITSYDLTISALVSTLYYVFSYLLLFDTLILELKKLMI
jgi:hypothetical protein